MKNNYSESQIINYLKCSISLNPSQLASVLSLYYSLPTVDLYLNQPDSSLFKRDYQLYYWRYRFVPWKQQGKIITIATSNYYSSLEGLLSALYPGLMLKFVIVQADTLETYLLDKMQGSLIHQSTEELWQNRPWQSAKQRFAPKQLCVFLGCISTWLAAAFYNSALSFKYAAFVMQLSLLGTAIFNLSLFFTSWYKYRKPNSEAEPCVSNNHTWPKISILIALYREVEVIDQLIASLIKLEYDKEQLEIILVTEADDLETNQALASKVLEAAIQIVVVPVSYPRTKGKALNYALNFVTGEYVVVFDAEDVPSNCQLKRAMTRFASLPKEYICLQSQLNFYNYDQNWITRLFALEYSKWFEYVLPAMHHYGMPIPLGGSSNYFKVDYLRALGGWDPYNVTEDADLGTRIAIAGFKTYLMAGANTLEEAPIRAKSWLKQRLRWTKGYLQTYLVHTRRPKLLWKQLGGKQVVAFTMIYHMRYLVYLYMLMLTAFVVGNDGIKIWPIVLSTFFINVPSFVLINFRKINLGAMGKVRVKWSSLLLVPLYNIMYIGAVIASVVSLIKQPHYWHKTKHGRMLYEDALNSKEGSNG